jgi:DNA repair protein RecN (Recombination protein N)
MLGALGLLLGNRADTKVLLNASGKCVIEGTFQIATYKLEQIFESNDLDYSDQCIIRREISNLGKSRAFVNDTPVTLDVLKQLGSYLMDVHSQHDTLLLGSTIYQLSLLDSFASSHASIKKYQFAFKKFKDTQQELKDKRAVLKALQLQSDYNQFIYTELEDASLLDGELEDKEAALKKMEHAEDIKQKLEAILSSLNKSDQSVLPILQLSSKQLQTIKKWSPTYELLTGRMQSVYIELKDIEAELESESLIVEYNPQLIEPLETRLNILNTLLKKHRVQTVAELIQLKEDLSGKVLSTDMLVKEVEELEKLESVYYKEVLLSGKILSSERKNAAPKFEQHVKSLLSELSMPDAMLQIVIKEDEPSSSGIDKIQILFSANKGVTPGELKQVASGGEFSRLMLAIKYMLADKVALPTIIFDEIDTGISGEVSIQMGKMIRKMATRHQVMVITHLPQIAGMGDKHYFVYKDASGERSISRMKELNPKDRIDEIAKMIGGDKPTEIAIQNAKEMLAGVK